VTVTFDAAGPSSAGTSFTTGPGTWTHVNGGNGILVGVTTFTGSSNVVTGVTYGGVTVPLLGFVAAGTGGAGGIALYGLVGGTCPTGSNTVSVAVSDSSNHNAGSVSVSGAGSLGSPVTNSASATSVSAVIPSTTAGGLIVSAACQGSGGAFAATSPNVLRWSHLGSSSSGADNGASGTDPSTGGGASQTVTWTIAASDFWGIVAVEVLPPAAIPPPPPAPQSGRAWRRRRGPREAQAATGFPVPGPAAGAAAITGQGALSAAAAVAATAGITGQGTVNASTARYITGIAGTGTGQYFADQAGAPRLLLGDAAWGLPGNAGRWSSGDWQGDYDTYLANRAGQGYTAVYTKPIGTTQSGNIDDNGATFDSLYPFQGGAPSTGTAGANPSTGLTSAFWARIDYFLNSALAKGITVILNAIGYGSDFDGGPGPLAGKSATEFQAYGAALGARYAAQPNLIWNLADDYFGFDDTVIDAFLTGLRGAGDAHPVAIENFPETTSRQDLSNGNPTAWGAANAQFDFCYSYNVTYFGIETAYAESSPIPVIQGDGYFYQGSSSYSSTFDRAMRQDLLHALSSGARGAIQGSESIWQWQSAALASSASDWWYAHGAGAVRALFEALPGWHQLLPDTSSALVTAGRGTRATSLASGGSGGQYEPAFTDSYVTASRTPDTGSGSSLAVIYLSHAATITIDQSKMVTGYVASWVDPVSGAVTPATAGSTYSSAAPGSNSKGDPDWLLVLQADTFAAGAASITGQGTVAAASGLAAPGTITGQGAVGAAVTQAAGAIIAGQGAVTAASGLAAPAAITGQGLVAAAAGLAAAAVIGGQGGLAAAAGPGAAAGIGGQGTVAAASGLAAPGTITGQGTVAAASGLAAPAAIAGQGLVAAASGQAAVTGIGGQGAVSAVSGGAAQGTAVLAGQGLVAAASGQAAVTGIGGQGAVAAAAGLAAPAVLAGQGLVAAAAGLAAAAVIGGQGTVSAAGAPAGGGSSTIGGGGQVAPAAAVSAGGLITGLGSVAAAGGPPPPSSRPGTAAAGTWPQPAAAAGVYDLAAAAAGQWP